MTDNYRLQVLVGTARAIFWPPSYWGRAVSLGTLFTLVGLGLQPELKREIDRIVESLIGVTIPFWAYFVLAACILIVGMGVRVAVATTPRVRFLQPKLEAGAYWGKLTIPVQKQGGANIQFTPLILVNGQTYVLLTEERARGKANSADGKAFVGLRNLGASPKSIEVLSFDFLHKKIKINHEQGEESLPIASSMRLIVRIDDMHNCIEKEITIIRLGTELHLSDGVWGGDIYWGGDISDYEEGGDKHESR